MTCQLITAKAAAAALCITPRSLRTLVATGQLPCVRVGTRAVRYDPRDIQAFVQRRKQRRQAS